MRTSSNKHSISSRIFKIINGLKVTLWVFVLGFHWFLSLITCYTPFHYIECLDYWLFSTIVFSPSVFPSPICQLVCGWEQFMRFKGACKGMYSGFVINYKTREQTSEISYTWLPFKTTGTTLNLFSSHNHHIWWLLTPPPAVISLYGLTFTSTEV